MRCTTVPITSNGSRFFAGNVADHDTELVARYKRGGLVIFGKTNTPEFGLTVSYRADTVRGDTQSLETRQHGRRLEWRRGGGGGGRNGAGRACLGRRRFDPHSRFVLRAVRVQADARAQSGRTRIAARAGPA